MGNIGIHDQPHHYLFVYGTLRKACTTGAHKHYLAQAGFVSPAKIRGQLFMVDYYPGLTLTDTEHWVIGEVYLLEDYSALQALDIYEDCAEQSPPPHEYQRCMAEVVLSNGETLQAWTYVYQQDTTLLQPIKSGDFLNRC